MAAALCFCIAFDLGVLMEFGSPAFWIALLQIVWIDLLLSGDNAIVIALACRNLPENSGVLEYSGVYSLLLRCV